MRYGIRLKHQGLFLAPVATEGMRTWSERIDDARTFGTRASAEAARRIEFAHRFEHDLVEVVPLGRGAHLCDQFCENEGCDMRPEVHSDDESSDKLTDAFANAFPAIIMQQLQTTPEGRQVLAILSPVEVERLVKNIAGNLVMAAVDVADTWVKEWSS